MASNAKRWNDLQPRLRAVVLRDGVSAAAHSIPASPATVYRMLQEHSHSRSPTLAVLHGVERYVKGSPNK